jgi:Cd2+/Zn2+-exporting ATPase
MSVCRESSCRCHEAVAPAPRAGERLPRASEPVPRSLRRDVLRIADMDCPTEEALIRTKLSGRPGIARLDFDLLERTLTVAHSLAELDGVRAALAELGMHAEPLGSEAAPPPRTTWWLLAAGAICAASAEIAHSLARRNSPLVIALCLAAVAVGGLGTYKKGWIALRHGSLNINALMSIAVTGAMILGDWPEAAMVMVLFALAERIEALSLERARNAIRGLLAMAPEVATVRMPDGAWRDLRADEVGIGATVRVRPGERIALDGTLLVGRSTVNQAPITGESVPVQKQPGDPVFAGTVNEAGSFELRVTATAGNSTLSRIIHAVETAQASRAPTQRFVDRFARIYTPTVLAVALVVGLGPPLVLGAAWFASIYQALVLLVIACPCALVISTPVTLVSGLCAAARHGILIKGGAHLEAGRRLRWVALDKTGTVTEGKPELTDLVPIDGDPARALAIGASLAACSDHPVSSAVGAAFRARAGQAPLQEVSDFSALQGRGVAGRIGGIRYTLGNHRLVEELGICTPATEAALAPLEAEGKTAVVVCDESTPLAVLGVADRVRGTSARAMAELHALGVSTVMLSGDNPQTASAMARAVGIDDARGGLLPEDKLAAIDELLSRHGDGAVGMVGDGINDAPALARASIGFAMGAAGSDTAIETADVALMNDDLRKIPQFVRLSRATSRTLAQNIALALGIKLAFFALAATGRATMWMAVFADMGASLLVVLNGLRLLGFELPRRR